MATYTIQNPPSLLRHEDQVIFEYQGEQFSYEVRHSYLCGDRSNSEIFVALGLHPGVLAEGAYGYRPGCYGEDGCWPEFKSGDYAAATRLVWLLFGQLDLKEAMDIREFINPQTVIQPMEELLRKGSWDPIRDKIYEIAGRMIGVQLR